jgi:hypothetical protein
MKRLLILTACALAVSGAFADSVTVTVSATGAAAFSSPILASGYLDRVEIVKSGDNDVVGIDLATFEGTTALQTFVDINALATATDTVVIRPRAVGTGASGTAFTAAGAIVAGASTNAVAGTVLVAPYERYMIGGNLKLKVSAGDGTNATVKAIIYYDRTPK